jgi:hypothetical protein
LTTSILGHNLASDVNEVAEELNVSPPIAT